jgi:rubrerythrin
MDLGQYSLEDIYLSAIKSEAEAKTAYETLEARVANAFLKERLRFLATEEGRHREFLERAYGNNFLGKEPPLPERSPVPLPEVDVSDESVPLSQVLESAMAAEAAASKFYAAFAAMFDEGSEMRRTLEYFSTMEQGHYELLAVERENALNFEDYDDYWPMMHAGP